MKNQRRHTQQSDENPISELSFAIVGVARNCEKAIRGDIHRINKAISGARASVWLIVESDSSDGTLSELEELKTEIPNFHFVSLGRLEDSLPLRTQRLSYCRNYYADKLMSDQRFSEVDFVVVADLDGVNNKLSKRAFESSWGRNDWDVCAANQDGPYYDVWALRHSEWSPGDALAQFRFLNDYRLDWEENLRSSVLSKMITIPRKSKWIEVESAFGGLAIYRKRLFELCEYRGVSDSGEEVCEHVHFHQILRATGARLFINPELINAGRTQHTEALLARNVLKRRARWALARFTISLVGLREGMRLQNMFGKRRNRARTARAHSRLSRSSRSVRV